MTGFLSCPFIVTNVVPAPLVGADWLRPTAAPWRVACWQPNQAAQDIFAGGRSNNAGKSLLPWLLVVTYSS